MIVLSYDPPGGANLYTTMMKFAIALFLFLAFNVSLPLLVSQGGQHFLYQENGVIENLQALLLAGSCYVFLRNAGRCEKQYTTIFLLLALISASCFFREFDVREFGWPALITSMISGDVKNGILVLLAVPLVIRIVRQFHLFKAQITRYALSCSGLLFCLSGLLLVFGGIFDRGFFHVPLYRFYEELAELNGYFFYFLSAVRSRQSLVAPASGRHILCSDFFRMFKSGTDTK